jgi:hypothetical protein
MYLKSILLIGLTLFLFTFLPLKAEFSSGSAFSGYVKDSETGETLIGASVYIKGASYGTRTNKSGFFSLSNIPPGEYTFVATYLGYAKTEKKFKIELNNNIRFDFQLKPSSVQGDEIIVSAEKEVEKRQISISKVDIPIQELKVMRIGGESDVFRTLQYLPGILTISQISSGLYVRGGSPDQNLILLDGSPVYNPTHLFGFFSTFNTDAVKDIELIKGGFNAEFGGRLSSVLEITQKDGNRNQFQGNASIGLISSKASAEGPLGRGSWFVGARRTYLDIIKSAIPADPEAPLPDFGFYDVNAKISQNITENDKITLSGFLTKDAFHFNNTGISFDLNVGNQLAALNLTHIFSENLFGNLNASFTRYASNFSGDQSDYYFGFDNSIQDLTLKADLEWFTSEKLTHKFGVQTTKRSFSIYQNFTGNKDSTSASTDAGITDIKVNDWNYSAYSQINLQLDDLTSIQAGIRADYWNLKNQITLDPRLAIRYQLFENIALKFAWGIYHQNLRLLTNQNFSFFDTWLPSDSTVPISKSNHYILSAETEPWLGYNFNIDLYYKTLNDISEFNQTALDGKTVSDVFYIGNGYSYGFELFLQKKVGRFTGWVGYAFGYIISKFPQINYGKEFNPKYDRRNDFKIVLNYQINDSWSLGSSFVFQSGQPYTGATSRVRMDLGGRLDYGRNKIINSDLYGLRLPPSHQLNLNFNYSFKTFGLPSNLNIDIYNVYNRRDIWFRYYRTVDDITTVEDVKLLPIIPSLSYEIKF